MKNKYDVIVVGAGLAGLTTAIKLAKDKRRVLLIEKENYLGGRTSSKHDNGLEIEAGFHRHIGYYKELPKLLKDANVNLNDIVMWEKEAEIRLDNKNKIILGIAPFYHPIIFLKDILGNTEHLTLKNKLSMTKFFILGFIDYTFNPKELDNYSILEYAKKHNIDKNVIDYIITSLSTGIFFLPKEKYSAKLFFGIFYPGIFRMFKLRVGAYKGGMSDVISRPLAKRFEELGGTLKLNTKVDNLIYKNNKIIGVKIKDKEVYAKTVVLATDIGNSKKILKDINHPYIRKFLKIPTMSVLTVHLELKKPLMKLDRATFTPLTKISSFTEESRSTFKKSKGRISIIMTSTPEINFLTNEELLKLVIEEFKKVGINIKDNLIDYRVVRHIDKFYDLSKGNDKYRQDQKTPIKGLVLAGDYTKQRMYATMEGAVISGINAYKVIKEQN